MTVDSTGLWQIYSIVMLPDLSGVGRLKTPRYRCCLGKSWATLIERTDNLLGSSVNEPHVESDLNGGIHRSYIRGNFSGNVNSYNVTTVVNHYHKSKGRISEGIIYLVATYH